MDIQTQQTELKRLIIKGKDQGFLTYSEINDHLPEGMNDTDQIETVVNMINDMGIDVLDSAPDPDSLLLKTTNDEEEVVEEAEAVLTSAVESEFGRTTDPVRMYMREMGTVDLLTRQDEINLAKRIEDGIRQSISAIATCPLVVEEVIRLGDRLEEGKLKLPELLVGFVDPNADDDVILPGAQPGDNRDDESTGPVGPSPSGNQGTSRSNPRRLQEFYPRTPALWGRCTPTPKTPAETCRRNAAVSFRTETN